MSEPVAIISSSEIHKDELMIFLQGLGASINEDTQDPFIARLSKGWQHVWIALDNRLFNEYETDEIELLIQKLAGKPQTSIVLEISGEPESQELALGLACSFAERWTCIVDNFMGKVFSSQELFDLRNSGGNLW